MALSPGAYEAASRSSTSATGAASRIGVVASGADHGEHLVSTPLHVRL